MGSVVVTHRLVALQHVGYSVSCIGWWILNHCTTNEALMFLKCYYKWNSKDYNLELLVASI